LRTTPVQDQIPVPVPAIIDETLFRAAQERLGENRKRNRRPPQCVRYLLQGLLVCGKCGYAFCGQTTPHRNPGGGPPPYQYYLCTGSMFGRCDRERVCWNKSVRMEPLDAAVWEDVRDLLADPRRVEAEYRRQEEASGRRSGAGDSLDRSEQAARQRVARLVDAYEDGLLEKPEFEPRIARARERLAQLEREAETERRRRASEQELRDVSSQLERFGDRVRDGLQNADRPTRREIIRTLVKRVEIGESEVRVVYKVNPFPFAAGPERNRGRFQDCVRRGWVRRSSSAAVIRSPWNTLPHSLNGRLLVTSRLRRSYRSANTWNSSSAPARLNDR
jgi:site-specific DNA recombinase